ncbi:MAG: helix-turn-helix transcriptional regulator [Clostridia bacterium]|nr:helix-turn-helix transcriptional regulator [Clostridia bacterium]
MKDFFNDDFNIQKLVLCCFVGAGAGKHDHRNRPSHGLAYHCSGAKEYIFEDGPRLTVHAGEIICLPRSSTYRVLTLEPGECYAINFQEEEELSPFIFPASDPGFPQAFRRAERLWKAKKPGYLAACKAELYHILALMQQKQGYQPSKKMELIHPAVEYIEEHYDTEPLSIARLAALCDITPEYFRRLFGSFLGCSPIKYINRLKTGRAKELLDSGMYSLHEAATLSGYTDMSHFSREFKKAFGISPSAYRKKV